MEERWKTGEGETQSGRRGEPDSTERQSTLSCIDCGVVNCRKGDRTYPDFCLTTGLEEDLLAEALAEYEKPDVNRIAVVAAEVEADYYCKLTRVEETMEFARGIGAKKLGIATCVGLMQEARTAAKIFRKNGFEVYGVACKCGAVRKTDIGIPARCEKVGPHMCSPILQAKLLNREKTELNVLIGLCVGHDSLFYKYSDAPVTTLVAKDRVLAHNPVGALYQADKYYRRLTE